MFVALQHSKRCHPCSRYSHKYSLLYSKTHQHIYHDIHLRSLFLPYHFRLNPRFVSPHLPIPLISPTISPSTASAPAPRQRKIPLWASRLALSESKLEYILQCLEDLKTLVATDRVLKFLGIELHELDLQTGATPDSIQHFFLPRDDGKASISNTPLNPEDGGQDDFTCYRRLRKEGIHVELGLQTHLAIAFKDYAYGLVKAGRPQLEWKLIQKGSPGKERFHSRPRDAFNFYVTHGEQLNRGHQSHRQVWMESEDEPDPDRLMISELVVLLSWMLGAMHPKRTARSIRARNSLPCNHVFPTMVISFQPRAKARVLYGYFDGTLKVHMTKHREFDMPDYVYQMDTLLKWAWPNTNGVTTRILPLPTIMERDEDDMAVGEIKKPATSAPWLKCRWKKVSSFACAHLFR